MPAQIEQIAMSVLLLTGMIVGVHVLLRDAAGLGLGLFRPYRKLAWPFGVQEDDDARFSWTRGPRPVDDAPEDPLEHVAARPRPAEGDHPRFEVFPARAVPAEHVDRVSVHRARR
jgi:hypothetical protein